MMTLKIDVGEMVRAKFENVRMLIAGYRQEAMRDDENNNDWNGSYAYEAMQAIEAALKEGMDKFTSDVVLQVPEGSDAVIVDNRES